MNATSKYASTPQRTSVVALSAILSILITTQAAATQLLLKRSDLNQHPGEYMGVVDLAIDPGVEGAKVNVTIDGQKIATNLLAPYHLNVDFGPTPLHHKITITAIGTRK